MPLFQRYNCDIVPGRRVRIPGGHLPRRPSPPDTLDKARQSSTNKLPPPISGEYPRMWLVSWALLSPASPNMRSTTVSALLSEHPTIRTYERYFFILPFGVYEKHFFLPSVKRNSTKIAVLKIRKLSYTRLLCRSQKHRASFFFHPSLHRSKKRGIFV